MMEIPFGVREGRGVIERFVGKRISTARIITHDGEDDEDDSTSLDLTFGDRVLRLTDAGQNCCEHRYMHTDDKLGYFDGARFLGMRKGEGAEGSDEDYDQCNVKESEFLIVKTDRGEFTVVNYNEHNGYYGGFDIVAAEIGLGTPAKAIIHAQP